MRKITSMLLLIVPLVSFSQNEISTLSKKEQRKGRPAYIGISSGLSYSVFRDFATSPLIFYGSPIYVSLSYVKADKNRESEFGLSYSFGKYNQGFNGSYTISQVKTASVYYSQLYRLNKLSFEKFTVKVGGLLNISGNIRYNMFLMNNALGVELLPNLFGSVKITKDISRTENKNKKFLFLKYKLNRKTRNLSYRLNIGLINCSYRNGYAYFRHDLDQSNPFYGYEFKAFSGFRISSALDYTVFLKNKNAIQLSYLWDAYKTGDNPDKFEMAYHTFKLTLLFNSNNK